MFIVHNQSKLLLSACKKVYKIRYLSYSPLQLAVHIDNRAFNYCQNTWHIHTPSILSWCEEEKGNSSCCSCRVKVAKAIEVENN